MSKKISKSSAAQNFTSREQNVIVRYLFHQDVDPSEIHKLLTAACGKDAPTYKDVKAWITDILEGREEIDNCVCSGGRKISGLKADAPTDPALVARVEFLLKADRRISLERLAELSMSSVQTIQSVLSSLLGLKKVCEKWVPRTWTPEQRDYRIEICHELLNMYQEEGVDMLKRIIVGDASFVLYHSGNGQCNGVSNNEQRLVKYKPSIEPEKVYCALFFDMNGIIVSEVLPHNSPPNAEEYIQILKETVMPAFRRKRGNNSSKPLYLLHSMTHEHNAISTQHALKDMQIIPLPNAVSSPDLEPFEYWLFRHLKRALDDLRFTNTTDLCSTLAKTIHGITDLEFNNSISRLVDRWNICIEKQGLYLL